MIGGVRFAQGRNWVSAPGRADGLQSRRTGFESLLARKTWNGGRVWFIAAVPKTVVLRHRGFKSFPFLWVRSIVFLMGYAKEKQREYQRLWLARRRKKWLDENGPCARCGSSKDLNIDHKVPGSREGGTGNAIFSRKESVRRKELAKCQVLCRPCHVIKSMECGERHVTTHGRANMYIKHKCRCDLCKEYKRQSNKKYR